MGIEVIACKYPNIYKKYIIFAIEVFK